MENKNTIKISDLFLKDENINPNDYQYFKFFKPGIKENEIYKIIETSLKKNIGWIIPVTALTSNNHDYINDKIFLKYAFATYKLILKYESDKESIVFNQNTAFLVIDKKEINKTANFNIKYYYSSLFQYGYLIKDIKIKSQNFKTPEKKIKIQTISNKLYKEKYIDELFNNLIFEQHPLVKFHVLYQVIELFIERILLNEIKILSKRIEKKEIYSANIDEELKKFKSEERRINKLFSNYTENLNSNIKKAFKDECNFLLEKLGDNDAKNKYDIHKSIYKIRNYIVHDYRNIPFEYHENLKKINSVFDILITDLLINYIETI